MKEISSSHYYIRAHNKKRHFPLKGQIDLTYRCNLNCIHCYSKVSENKNKELSTDEWKSIFDIIQKEGCIWLTITGGDPLVRNDFLELYAYARTKGFIITIFTNGQDFSDEIIDYLVKSPPHSIEITLNGITESTYEAITRSPGSFSRVMQIIKILTEKKLPLILKCNCLKQNQHEIVKIKAFSEKLLGKPSEDRHYFKYDTMLYPRLNGDKTPTNFRLSWEETLGIKKQDIDMWDEYQKSFNGESQALKRDRKYLYKCNAWMTKFYINPYGRLKFCNFSDRFSVDLKITSFRAGFYKVFPQLLNESYKTNSKCIECDLRLVCYHCPSRAYLETGDEEAPVPYFCELAREAAKQMYLTKTNE